MSVVRSQLRSHRRPVRVIPVVISQARTTERLEDRTLLSVSPLAESPIPDELADSSDAKADINDTLPWLSWLEGRLMHAENITDLSPVLVQQVDDNRVVATFVVTSEPVEGQPIQEWIDVTLDFAGDRQEVSGEAGENSGSLIASSPDVLRIFTNSIGQLSRPSADQGLTTESFGPGLQFNGATGSELSLSSSENRMSITGDNLPISINADDQPLLVAPGDWLAPRSTEAERFVDQANPVNADEPLPLDPSDRALVDSAVMPVVLALSTTSPEGAFQTVGFTETSIQDAVLPQVDVFVENALNFETANPEALIANLDPADFGDSVTAPFQPVFGLAGTFFSLIHTVGQAALSLIGVEARSTSPIADFIEPVVELADIGQPSELWELKIVEGDASLPRLQGISGKRHFELRDIDPEVDSETPTEHLELISLTLLSLPRHGELEQLGTKATQFRYVPDPGFTGVDAFRYRMKFSNGQTREGEVVIDLPAATRPARITTADRAVEVRVVQVATADTASAFAAFAEWNGELD